MPVSDAFPEWLTNLSPALRFELALQAVVIGRKGMTHVDPRRLFYASMQRLNENKPFPDESKRAFVRRSVGLDEVVEPRCKEDVFALGLEAALTLDVFDFDNGGFKHPYSSKAFVLGGKSRVADPTSEVEQKVEMSDTGGTVVRGGVTTVLWDKGPKELVSLEDWLTQLLQQSDAELGRLSAGTREKLLRLATRLEGDKLPQLADVKLPDRPESRRRSYEPNSEYSHRGAKASSPEVALAAVIATDVLIAPDREKIAGRLQELLKQIGCVDVDGERDANLKANSELADAIANRLSQHGLQVQVRGNPVVGTVRFSTGGGSGITWRFVVHGKKEIGMRRKAKKRSRDRKFGKASSATFDNDFSRLMIRSDS